jgi:hypothetical protein
MTTMNCFIDIETRSGRKLHTVSLRMYAHDPSTKVLCVGYALDDQPVQIWIPDKDPAPCDLTAAWKNPACNVVGHNVIFDSTVIERTLGFHSIPLERLVDTMARARARSLPAGLDLLTRRWALSIRKIWPASAQCWR